MVGQVESTDWSSVVVDPVLTTSLAGNDAHWVGEVELHPVRQVPAVRRVQGITVPRNAVPFHLRPPRVSSGVRIGTAAPAARDFDRDDSTEMADVVAATLRLTTSDGELRALRGRVTRLADRHPLSPHLSSTDLVGAGR